MSYGVHVQVIPTIFNIHFVLSCIYKHYVIFCRSKSQGTSTLRHHKCPYVFQVLQAEMGAGSSLQSLCPGPKLSSPHGSSCNGIGVVSSSSLMTGTGNGKRKQFHGMLSVFF